MTKENLLKIIEKTDNKTLAAMYKEAVKDAIEKYEVCPGDNQLILPVFDSKGQLKFKIRTYTGLFVEVKEDNLSDYESLLSSYNKQKQKLERDIENNTKKHMNLLSLLASEEEELNELNVKTKKKKINEKLDLLYLIQDRYNTSPAFKGWLTTLVKKTEKELDFEQGQGE